jgi:hypothetical protein
MLGQKPIVESGKFLIKSRLVEKYGHRKRNEELITHNYMKSSPQEPSELFLLESPSSLSDPEDGGSTFLRNIGGRRGWHSGTRKAFGSNIGLNTNFRDFHFPWFPSVPPDKGPESASFRSRPLN